MSSEEPQKTGLEEKQHSNSILLLKNKDLNRNLSPLHVVAGVAGFEPTNVGTKSRCLTTWRHPKTVFPMNAEIQIFLKNKKSKHFF